MGMKLPSGSGPRSIVSFRRMSPCKNVNASGNLLVWHPMCDPHLSLLVKAQDVVAHTAGPATLHLVFVSEELLPGEAPPVVKLSVRQHSQQSALTSIHVAHDCNPNGRRSIQTSPSITF
ncbi:hypothetical protein EYF80_006488 [Liparis tanakae]|uniref:Uncharacterized protein n=1 Tax=Liparis tanakae TaxID=230148 RepID=A0A4Z2J0F9_9TELE|nr:hypothetical protein EYF80_006488 [Liparis tanakae]